MSQHPYGWLSLLPPLAAITLAIVTRHVLLSLTAGVFVGALLLAGGNPFVAVGSALETHLWGSLSDSDHLRVFVFTLLMGAMVGVMQRSGGMEGIVRGLAPLARSRRGGQLIVWLLGMIVFFDDYANSLLLGHTMRPLTDRLRISREKLAYLVDSTAAPVSGLAIVSTWVAGEIGFIRDGFANLDLPQNVDGFDIFVQTIPYRFYVLWALAFVPLVAILGRDLWSMYDAERAAADREAPAAGMPGSSELAAHSGDWSQAVIPILCVVGTTVALILYTGANAFAGDNAQATWFRYFSNGDSYIGLVYGSLTGLIVAIGLAYFKRVLSLEQAQEAALAGARHVLTALAILWLAWALSGLTDEAHLGTGDFLGNLLRNTFDVRWMPTAVFILASLVAFATGTSWGTMGILMPLVVPVTYRMLEDTGGAGVSAYDPLLVAAIGSVLAGSIFGDHCSPISDTTVLSSQASGCDHIAHVRTQLPYALLVAVISVICGTLPVGFGVSVWWLTPVGLAALVASLLIFGKRVERAQPLG